MAAVFGFAHARLAVEENALSLIGLSQQRISSIGSNHRGSGARSHRISGADRDVDAGVRDVHQEVPSVDEVDVHRVGVQPSDWPRIDNTEPEAAELEAGQTTDHDRAADVKLMAGAEARVKTAVGNPVASMEGAGGSSAMSACHFRAAAVSLALSTAAARGGAPTGVALS